MIFYIYLNLPFTNYQKSALKTLKINNDKDKCINLVGLYSKLGLNG